MKKFRLILVLLVLIFCALPFVACNSGGKYTITFESNGGSAVSSQKLKADSLINVPIVIKNGYELEGWYTSLDGGLTLYEKWSFHTGKVNSNFTLYAKWSLIEYKIIYDLKGGQLLEANVESYNIETETFTLNNPQWINYDYYFQGWSDKENLSNPSENFIVPKGSVGDMTITAVFSNTPINISSKTELMAIDAYKPYKLTANIDLGGMEWTPLPHYYSVFNGNGYKISNFKITAALNSLGLFEDISGAVKNLGVTDFEISSGEHQLLQHIGGLSGGNKGIISNCYAIGTIKSNGDFNRVGGLIGYNFTEGSIINSFANCIITVHYSNSNVWVGGLVGTCIGSITGCYAAGTLSGGNYAGGLVGCLNGYGVGYRDAEIINSYAIGYVQGVYVGGLVGYILGTRTTISNCYRNNQHIQGGYTDSSGTLCTSQQLNSLAFYTGNLLWLTSDWNLTDLDFANGKYPTPKVI